MSIYLISSYYEDSFEKIKNSILNEEDSTIIGTKIDELSDYYYEKYCLQEIVIDNKQKATLNPIKYMKTIDLTEIDDFWHGGKKFKMECEKIEIEIPILENKKIQIISKLDSSTSFVNWSKKRIFFEEKKITFSIETKGYQLSLNEDSIKQKIESEIENIKKIISWKNIDMKRGNKELKEKIKLFILNRLEKLKQDKEKISSLIKKINIPLKKKENCYSKKINLSHKPIIKKIKPTVQQPEEYTLDSKKVTDIIGFLDNQGKQFEKTPKSYKNMNEEALRDILLVNLNSIFEGNATGETFSKKGKTDIYLNIDKGNILIFECKFWKGENSYNSSINQLRKYLTWRNNFGVIITFCKNKNFSEILKKVGQIVKNNPFYIDNYNKVGETHFVSRHSIENDKKTVEIHHLFYNLYEK